LVCGGVGVDPPHRDGAKWRVAFDRDYHSVALCSVACVEGHVSCEYAVSCLGDTAVRQFSRDRQGLYRIGRRRIAGLRDVQVVGAKRPVCGKSGKDRGFFSSGVSFFGRRFPGIGLLPRHLQHHTRSNHRPILSSR
jgi:hypothetical protein